MYKPMMLWGYPIQDLDAFEAKGVPGESSGDIGISTEFNPKKTHPDFDFPWVVTVVRGPLPPMPAEVFVCIKKYKTVAFDFLPYGDFLLVSARLFSFLREQGFHYDFDMSKAILVDTKGKRLTDEEFLFIRKGPCLIDEELVWSEETDSQVAQVGTYSGRNVLLSEKSGFESCLFVSPEIRDAIERQFRNPSLYTLSEWIQLDDLGWDI